MLIVGVIASEADAADSIFPDEFYANIIGGYATGDARFDVVPELNVPARGGFFEVGMGYRVGMPNGNWFVGAQGSLIFGSRSASTSYPPSGFSYRVDPWSVPAVAAEVTLGHQFHVTATGGIAWTSAFATIIGTRFQVSGGVVLGHQKVTATPNGPGPGITEDEIAAVGWTIAARVDVPLTSYLDATAQVRWVHFGEQSFNIPGKVDIATDQFLIGIGVTLKLNPPPPPPRRSYDVM